MCGYAGGFVGPPLAGFVLDLAGRDSVAGWGLAFGHLAVITLAGFAILLRLSTPRRVPAGVVSAD
jgi:MFS family permease